MKPSCDLFRSRFFIVSTRDLQSNSKINLCLHHSTASFSPSLHARASISSASLPLLIYDFPSLNTGVIRENFCLNTGTVNSVEKLSQPFPVLFPPRFFPQHMQSVRPIPGVSTSFGFAAVGSRRSGRPQAPRQAHENLQKALILSRNQLRSGEALRIQ